MITLEKIDQVVQRTGVSYEQAKTALEQSHGDVLEAIIYLEKQKSQKSGSGKQIRVSDIIDTLKDFIHKGNVTRIIISDDETTLLNIPVTFGAIGVVLAPVIAVLGVGAAIVTNLNVSIKDYNGNIIDLNKVTAERLDALKRKGEQVRQKAEEKADDIKEAIYKKSSEPSCACKENQDENIVECEVVEEEPPASETDEQ
ncbi:MAG: DUF4342 domain-containing protein [Peptostreptococcaceae bacterium]|nr:DUF4342 domain-containing protein [Peptostreptococcaceae bacterium]